MTPKKILFLVASDIRLEQRVNKELNSLCRGGYKLVLADFPASNPNGNYQYATYRPQSLLLRRLPKNILFWPLKYCELVIRFICVCVSEKPDIIHCVDRLALIPAGLASMLMKASVVYDSQEIWPEVNTILNKPKWLWLLIERFFAKRCRYVLVTDKFRKEITIDLLGLDPRKVLSLMNLPMFRALQVANSDVRRDSSFLHQRIMVYAGGISPHRHIEEIIASLTYLPDEYALVIMGFGSDDYIASLRKEVCRHKLETRVAFLPAVKWNELPNYLSTADCSFALYEKNSVNNIYCSPSKIFDSFLAGLPVISTDNPLVLDLASRVDAIGCIEIVTPNTIALAVKRLLTGFNGITQKNKLIMFAKQNLVWENQESRLVDVYADTLQA